MPASLTRRTGNPAPGEVVSGQIGALQAAIHTGFPGVLLGVGVFASEPVTIRRYDGDTGWITVRSAAPVQIEGGTGEAYDIEACPGATYLYRLVTGDTERPAYDVRVAMPSWDELLPPRHTGWLKSLLAPHLSMPVRMGAPGEATIGLHARTDTSWGSRHAAPAWGGRGPKSGTYIVHGLPVDDHDAIEALLTSGPLLWQPRPGIRTATRWISVTGLRDLEYGGHDRARQWSIDWTEIPRPDPTDPVAGDDLVTVPGWTWDRYTRGLTWDDLGRIYGDSWGLLREGARQPWVHPYAVP